MQRAAGPILVISKYASFVNLQCSERRVNVELSPMALAAVLRCWITAQFGAWAFGQRAGQYAGLCLATCVGLFLFTRVLIPDVMLTLTITLALWCLLRALDPAETRPRLWAMLMWA